MVSLVGYINIVSFTSLLMLLSWNLFEIESIFSGFSLIENSVKICSALGQVRLVTAANPEIL